MWGHFPEDEYIESSGTFQISNCLPVVKLIVQYSGTVSSKSPLNFPIEDN